MSNDKIVVDMNIHDIPILIELLEKDKKEITDLQQKVEQLENIRKETIEYIQENYNELTDYGYIDKKEIVDDLLNTLNKEIN